MNNEVSIKLIGSLKLCHLGTQWSETTNYNATKTIRNSRNEKK